MVSREEKEAMAKLMATVTGAFSEDSFANITSVGETGQTQRAYNPTLNEGAKKAMGEILGRFRDATNDMQENAYNMDNDALFEALQTETTPTGVRIAEWEVTISNHPTGLGKCYDVTRDDIIIARDLRLYDAAQKLVESLNNGDSITSIRVRKILALEAKYAAKLEEAITYARKAKSTAGKEADIARARLDEAKSTAQLIQRQIRTL